MTATYYNEIDPFAASWLRNLIAAGRLPAGDVDERSIVDVSGGDLAGYGACHFFAGIGGWPLALRLAGVPDSEPIWTGSCPCQPFSVAGRGAGTADERHLWPAFRELIAERRPASVFGEQVASSDGRLWLAGVRADLEELGYAVGAADLCAAGVSAPHLRQRLYWVADATGERHRSGTDIERERAKGEPERGVRGKLERRGGPRGGLGDTESNGRTWRCEHSDRECPQWNRHIPTTGTGSNYWADAILIQCGDGKARRTPADFAGLVDGFPAYLGRDRSKHFSEAAQEVERYANATQGSPIATVRALWNLVQQEPPTFRPVGERAGVSAAQILLTYLREHDRHAYGGRAIGEGQEVPKADLRSLRRDESDALAPHGRQPNEQRPGQHSDALRSLSYVLAQHAEEAWTSHCRENARPAAVLSHGECNRVGRLKGYGNAIVPPVAAEFIRAALR